MQSDSALAVILKDEMFTEQVIEFTKLIGKIILLSLTCFLSFAYGTALSMKIEHPNFKNLPTSEFVIFGVIIIILIYINLKVFGILKAKKSRIIIKGNDIRDRIRLVADGIPLKLDNLTIQTTNSGKLLVTGWTNTVHFENISRDKILQELENLKKSYSELTKSFKELDDVVKKNRLTIEYHMAYDDTGKSGIGLCSEIDEKLDWYIEK